MFTYTPVHDVLEVGKSDFEMCRVSHPLNAYRDGESTVISLSSEGSRYFICGRHGYCDMGLKLQLQVLPSLNTTTATSNSTIAPAPAAAAAAGPSAHETPPPPPQPSSNTSSSSSTSPLSPINSNPSSAAYYHVNPSRSLINWWSCFPFITTLPLLLLLLLLLS